MGRRGIRRGALTARLVRLRITEETHMHRLTHPRTLIGALLALTVWAPAPAHALNFNGPTNIAVGNAPQAVHVADFNGDLDPDLAVTNQNSNDVSILLGGAGGTFSAATNFPVGLTPLSLGVGEFNGDNDPDLAVANEGAGTVSVLVGGAGGSFSAPTDYVVGTTPQAVGVGEFNGDSDPDLAVVNEGTNNVSVMLGAAGATFSSPTNFSVGGLPRGVVVRDFNGDNDPDLAVANEATNNVSILLGAAGGSFTGPSNVSVCTGPTAITAGEFNGDTDPDLATANELCHNVSALGGATGGTFTGLTNSPVDNLPDDIAVGEFNGDSDQDLAVANQGSDNISVLAGAAGLAFISPANFGVGDQPTGIAVGDFNADLRSDIAVTNELTDNVSILLGTTLDGHPRPQGASPMRLALVPAFDQCAPGSANRTHGPSLENPSCNPPVQSSGFATIGAPDANSNPVQSVGSVKYTVCVTGPCAGGPAPDVVLEASVTDVRNLGTLTDYAGELQARVTLRITDKVNGASLTESGTLGDRLFAFTVPCTPTGGAANVGSTCSVTTGANALVPGMVPGGKRTVWQAGQVEVLDGGPDGDVDTPAGNTVFARQGIFVP